MPKKRPLILALSALSLACYAVPKDDGTADVKRTDWAMRLPDPVSAGTTFESPIIETGLEGHVVTQEFPDDSIFGGGDFQLYALQARYAVNERLAIIATKDGYIDLDPDVGDDESGLADIAGGFKYLVYENEDSGILVTPGLIFETTTGDDEVFQGNGDGLFRPFISGALDLDRTNLISTFGYNLPLDTDEESTSFDYHLHISYELTPEFLPLFEINGITYTKDGDALPVNFEGGDLINLGSDDVDGNTVITGALGVAYKPARLLQIGITYEWPLTSREDLLDNRIWLAILVRH